MQSSISHTIIDINISPEGASVISLKCLSAAKCGEVYHLDNKCDIKVQIGIVFDEISIEFMVCF